MENASTHQAASLLAALACAALGCGGVAARAIGVTMVARWSKTAWLMLMTLSKNQQVAELATATASAATGTITQAMDTTAKVVTSAAVSTTRRHACAAGYGEDTWAFQACLFVPSDAQHYTIPLAMLVLGLCVLVLCTFSLCSCVCCYVCYSGAYWGAREKREADPHGAAQDLLGRPYRTPQTNQPV